MWKYEHVVLEMILLSNTDPPCYSSLILVEALDFSQISRWRALHLETLLWYKIYRDTKRHIYSSKATTHRESFPIFCDISNNHRTVVLRLLYISLPHRRLIPTFFHCHIDSAASVYLEGGSCSSERQRNPDVSKLIYVQDATLERKKKNHVFHC